MSSRSVTPFFTPHGVAMSGASHGPVKLGYGLARNLVQSNYQGVVHFVNPKGGSLLGRPMSPGIGQVPDPVDQAILLIPAGLVPGVLKECGDRGLKAVIIGSSGFRETGEAGAALEDECFQLARSYGMHLLGPNSIGLLDTHLPIDATFLPPPGPPHGEVAFISHSGAICAAVIDWTRGQGFGLSRLVSLGNQVDVNETDMIAPVAADPFTQVVTLYLEGVSDGRRFVEEARRVTRKKPIIALKVGRYASGQRAVASHTGALAGQESAYNAAFRQAGVIRAETSEEMFDWARALAWCSPSPGRSAAVLTNAGGPGVTAVDSFEDHGLEIAALAQETGAALLKELPPAASVNNPVDMLASATPEQYAICLRLLLGDPGVDSAMVILPPPPMHTAGAVARALIPVIHHSDKPVVVALMRERLIQEAVEHFRAARVPEYRFPKRAASALAVLVQRADFLRRDEVAPKTQSETTPAGSRSVLEGILEPFAWGGDHALSQANLTRLLEAYAIPVLPYRLATSADEAVDIANQIGFPVVLKVSALDVVHKSDLGGVFLNWKDSHEVAEGYAALVRNLQAPRPGAEIQAVLVQRMLPGGQEVILGAVRDPQFGLMVMFGSGGTEVEGLKDVSFALAPVSRNEAEEMLEDTWAGRKLRGYRNLPPADRQAVLDCILHLAQLSVDFPQLTMVEINPMRVLPEGEGVVAVDVRGSVKLNR